MKPKSKSLLSQMPVDTSDIRQRMMRIWTLIESKQISAAEVRLHVSVARTILETLKVEMAAAHLNRAHIPAVELGKTIDYVRIAGSAAPR